MKLGVRLWESYAEQVYEHIQQNMTNKGKFILVLQYAKMKSWAGCPFVQNCMGNTIMLINPNLPEVANFRTR